MFAGLPQIDFGSINIPGIQAGGAGAPGPSQRQVAPDDPRVIRELLLNSPHELALLKERNPPLAEALVSGNIGNLTYKRISIYMSLVTQK